MMPDPALVERYRTRAPRYTSYPTAPHFGPVGANAVAAAAGRNAGPLSLYVHVPFCQRRCHYCGCHVEIRGDRHAGDAYVDSVLREADAWLGMQRRGRTLGQLAIGGGTPSFLLPATLRRLLDGLRERWPVEPDAELAIEVDPRTVSAAELENIAAIGFSRVNLGVQDVDPVVLAAVNRPQPFSMVESAFATLRSSPSTRPVEVGVDLVYGLPEQTETSFHATLDAVSSLRPGRIALFQYAHVPWLKPAQKLLDRFPRPNAELRTRMWALAREVLGAAGYVEVGMDHFARPEDPLVAARATGRLQRNFEGYTTHGGLDLYGLGVSSIGYFGGMYAQNTKVRSTWEAAVASGQAAVERGRTLSADDLRRRELILSLFCNFSARLGEGEWASFGPERARLRPLIADGLVVLDEPTIRVTEAGRFFIRNVCAVFDRYLEGDESDRRYSETA